MYYGVLMNSWDLVQVIMSSGTIQISYWFGKSRSRSRLKKAQLRNNCFYTLSILYTVQEEHTTELLS